jgi:hypothetical protein
MTDPEHKPETRRNQEGMRTALRRIEAKVDELARIFEAKVAELQRTIDTAEEPCDPADWPTRERSQR